MSVSKRLTRWVATALLAVALVLGPVTTSPAEAASPPKLTFKTEKVKVQGKGCVSAVVKVKVPVLKGSTKANRDRVAKWSKWMKKTLLETACPMSARAEGAIYKGRYLSVVTELRGWDVRSLNLDLKTGKTVKLSKFVSNKAHVFDFAKCDAINRALRGGIICGGGFPEVFAWRVTDKGVRIFSGYEGAPVDFLVPSKCIVKPSYKKQKKYVTKNVPTQSYYTDSVKPAKTKVTVQGNLITVLADGRSYYGVRGFGKVDTNGKLAWTPVFAPGEWGEEPTRYVAFASKSSNKAVRYSWA